MAYDKQTFLKNVTVICDTREQNNKHILSEFDRLKVKYTSDKNLCLGDYSFIIQDRDFSLSCVVERKANINELYGNVVSDRERIEKEFSAARSIINQFTLLIENCPDEQYLNSYTVPDWEMERYHRKVKNIGKECYSTVQSWKCADRYGFNVSYISDKANTAAKILEIFYWYWRNFKIKTASRRNRR